MNDRRSILSNPYVRRSAGVVAIALMAAAGCTPKGANTDPYIPQERQTKPSDPITLATPEQSKQLTGDLNTFFASTCHRVFAAYIDAEAKAQRHNNLYFDPNIGQQKGVYVSLHTGKGNAVSALFDAERPIDVIEKDCVAADVKDYPSDKILHESELGFDVLDKAASFTVAFNTFEADGGKVGQDDRFFDVYTVNGSSGSQAHVFRSPATYSAIPRHFDLVASEPFPLTEYRDLTTSLATANEMSHAK